MYLIFYLINGYLIIEIYLNIERFNYHKWVFLVKNFFRLLKNDTHAKLNKKIHFKLNLEKKIN
jgi:hypothetical protein